jgi:hypothetical protein
LQGDLWCDVCCKHVLSKGKPWERTYFAQTQAVCPYDVSLPPMIRERAKGN